MQDEFVTNADFNQFKEAIFTDLRLLVKQNSLDIHELKTEIGGLRKDMNEKFVIVFKSIDRLARLIAKDRVE
jgi:hypothetical protein